MYTLALRQERSNTRETIGEGKHERNLVKFAARSDGMDRSKGGFHGLYSFFDL
ncbi:MAG: hypothetical protein ACI9CB_002468 [Rhodothermales bacterium]|jgi:hypothetical protein